MTLDQLITALVYLAAVFLLFFAGKFVYDFIHSSFKLKEELVEKDNAALALSVTGYYFGLIIALGGVLHGESHGWVNDLIDIFFYGILSIIMLQISIFINDKVILRKFNNTKEIIQDQNAGTGVVEGANHVATGMILYGAMSGDDGSLLTAAAFWLAGQLVLILAGIVYNAILPFDLHSEIEKDNVAVGVAFAGVLIAIGNIVRIGSTGDFVSWSYNFTVFAGIVVFGLFMLPVLRFFTDRILLPGARLTDELVNQEKANLGAGIIEAFSYVGASFLIGWVF